MIVLVRQEEGIQNAVTGSPCFSGPPKSSNILDVREVGVWGEVTVEDDVVDVIPEGEDSTATTCHYSMCCCSCYSS